MAPLVAEGARPVLMLTEPETPLGETPDETLTEPELLLAD
jgi:hypothetical protein